MPMRAHIAAATRILLLALAASTAVQAGAVEPSEGREPSSVAAYRLRDAHWTLLRGILRVEAEMKEVSGGSPGRRALLESYRLRFQRQLAKVRRLERQQRSTLPAQDPQSLSDLLDEIGAAHLAALKMVSEIDFAPTAEAGCYGSIAGTVQGPGGPLMDVLVTAYTADGVSAGSTLTLADGSYRIDNLLAGEELYVITSNAGVLIDEVFDDVECPGGACNPAIGSAVTVSAGVISPGIDFVLAAGGTISGSVTALPGPTPLPFTTVNIFDAAGELVTSATSDLLDGTYVTGTGLPSGTYYVVSANFLGYLDELFDDIPCVAGAGCEPTAGTAVTVSAPNPTTGIDLELVLGGNIAGAITDSSTGLPLGDILVGIHDQSGQLIAFGASDVTGNYSILSGLPTAGFFAATGNLEGYVDELYDDIPCTGGLCTITSGQQIAVIQGQTTGGIDFALTPGGTFSGTVTKAADGSKLADVFILAHTAAGELVGTGTTGVDGSYTLASGLGTGSYRATTLNPLGLEDLLFDDFPCPESVCDVTVGTAIPVTVSLDTPNIDFALPGDALGSCDFEGCSTCSLTVVP